MKTHKAQAPKPAWKRSALFAISVTLLLLVSAAGAGAKVKGQTTLDTSYIEGLFDTQPVTFELAATATDVFYSDEEVEFLFQADDPDLDVNYGGSTTTAKTLLYAESADTNGDVGSVSYTMVNSTLNLTAFGDATNGDAADGHSTASLSIKPDTSNGLLETGGVYTWFRVRIWETSEDWADGTDEGFIYYLNVSHNDGTNYCGVQVGGDDDFSLITGTTPTSTDIYTGFTAGTWYIIKYKASGMACEGWVYDDSGTELAHLASTSTSLTYSSSTLFTVQWSGNGTANTVASSNIDWIYTTDTEEAAAQADKRASTDLTESYETTADVDADRARVEWSFNGLGLTNDSDSSEARNFLNHTDTYDSATSRKSVNDTQFQTAWGVTPELEKGAATKREQHLFANVISNPKVEFEKNLARYIQDKYDVDTAYIVDYKVVDNDVGIDILLSDALQTQMQKFYYERAPQVLADAGATVTLESGETVSPSDTSLSATAWTQWFIGAIGTSDIIEVDPIESIAFEDQDQFQLGMQNLLSVMREEFLGGVFMFQGDLSDLYSVESLGDSLTSAHYGPTTGPTAAVYVQAGWFGDQWNKLKSGAGSVKDAATKKLSGWKTTITSTVASKAAWAKSKIAAIPGNLPVVSQFQKFTKDPLGIATFIPGGKAQSLWIVVGFVGLIIVGIAMIYFAGTKRGRATLRRVLSTSPS